ncbi:MAG TPA: S8 family serine peptidase [Candidatus Aveggerthella excrementigallinarum]|nr:S8 family serine peptidase [Candidatus Aveggerthella excrementigallinarum]
MQPRTMLKPFAATALAATLALCPLTPAAMAEAVARVQAAVDGGGSALVVVEEGFDTARFARAGLTWDGLLDAEGADVTAEEAAGEDDAHAATESAAQASRRDAQDDGLSARGVSYDEDASVSGVYLVTAATEESADVVERAAALDGVLFAEADRPVEVESAEGAAPAAAATDGFDATEAQWALGAPGSVADVADPVSVAGAGELTGASADGEPAIVAVLDTGMDYTNPSLAGSFADLSGYPGLMEATGCGRWGVNATVPEGSPAFSDPMESGFHGTHVSGIIAANGAVSGIAPDARIVGVRVFDDDGSSYLSSVIRGIGWLATAKADYGLDVVGFNLSMGGTIGTANAMRAAMLVAEEHDIVAVVATGNSNVDMDSDAESLLSAGRVDSTIAVNSHDMAGERSSFSNYGAESTDVFAPGSYIMSTLPTSQARFLPYAAAASGDALVYEGFEADGATADASVQGGFAFSLVKGEGAEGEEATGSEPLQADSSRFYRGAASLAVPLTERWEEVPFPDIPDEVEYKLGGTVITDAVDLTAQDGWRVPTEDDPLLFGLSYAIQRCAPDSVEVSTSFRLADGMFSEPVVRTETWDYGTWGEWASADQDARTGAARVPDGVDYESFQVKVSIVMQWHDATSVPDDMTVNVDTVGVGYGAHSYGMLSGTSMASPMVTGSLAALSAAHPEESSQRVAARILGGARQEEALAGLCTTGGRLDLAAADGDASTLRPVVTGVKAEGGLLTLSGWFLGDGAGAHVRVGGIAAEIVSWNPDTAADRGSVAVRVPEGVAGEQEIVLARSDGCSWTVSAAVEDPATDFAELAEPSDASYDLTEAAGLAAYEGDVWLLSLGVPEREDVPELFRYRVADAAWDSGIEDESFGQHVGTVTASLVATDEGLYRVLGGVNPFDLRRYDEESGTFSAVELQEYPSLHEYTAVAAWGDKIAVVGTQQSAAGQFSTVSVVDPDAGTVRQVAGIAASTALASACSATVAGDELFVLLRTGIGTNWEYRLFAVGLTEEDAVREVALPAYDRAAPSIPSMTAVETLDGARVVVAGLPGMADGAHHDVWLLDPATDQLAPSRAVLQYGGTNVVKTAAVDGELYAWGVARQTPDRTFFRSIDLSGLGLRMTEDDPASPDDPDPEEPPAADDPTVDGPGANGPDADGPSAGQPAGQPGTKPAVSAPAATTQKSAAAKLAQTGDGTAPALAAFATLAVAAAVTIAIVRGARRDEAGAR